MSEWKNYYIGDVCETQTGPFGSQLHNEDYVKNGTPIVTVEHLGNKNFTTQNLPCVSDLDKSRLSKYCLKEGDIVFSRVGSVDRCSYVSYPYNGWLFSGRCIRLRPKDSTKLDSQFLYYHFLNEKTKTFIRNNAVGATMPSINTKLMNEVPISIPLLSEQKKIAAILSSLDEKIETNRKINARLEELAQALFKSWFVVFEPFGGKIPEDWEDGSIMDMCLKIASGSTPSSMNREFYNGNINWFTTKELRDNFLLDSKKHISERAHQSSSTKIFPNGTVLMAIYAAPTVGRLGILTSNSTFNQAAVGLYPKEEIGTFFLYQYLLNERNKFNNLAVGAAQQNLSVKFVKEYNCKIPSKEVLYNYNHIIKPIFHRIYSKSKESDRLAALRDTLLPKLMSGK